MTCFSSFRAPLSPPHSPKILGHPLCGPRHHMQAAPSWGQQSLFCSALWSVTPRTGSGTHLVLTKASLVFYFGSIQLTFWLFIYKVHSPLLTNMGYVTKSLRVVEFSLTSALLLTRGVICNTSFTSLNPLPQLSRGDNSPFPAATVRTRGHINKASDSVPGIRLVLNNYSNYNYYTKRAGKSKCWYLYIYISTCNFQRVYILFS